MHQAANLTNKNIYKFNCARIFLVGTNQRRQHLARM